MSYIENSSPPSTYAIAAVLNNEPGAWGRVLLSTIVRGFAIAPGLYLAGIRGRQCVKGAALSSVGLTTILFLLYIHKKNIMRKYK